MKETLTFNGLKFEETPYEFTVFSTRYGYYFGHVIGIKDTFNRIEQIYLSDYGTLVRNRPICESWREIAKSKYVHNVDWSIEDGRSTAYQKMMDLYHGDGAIYKSDTIIIDDQYLMGIFDLDGTLDYICKCIV